MDWHRRYLQQARWTRDLRRYLFEQAGLTEARRVLEVGCGTGAILSELPTHPALHGLDRDPGALARCRVHAPAASLTRGNALQLPYPAETFDIVYCHFLLLWVGDPLLVLREMKRVARSEAHILAFAEPDYQARLVEPPELVPLGQWQAEALKRQGADPNLGAQLADLFFQAGIRLVETGPIQGVESSPTAEEWELEWEVIESDLAEFIPSQDLAKMRSADFAARRRGERVWHVPTYFAWGRA